MRGSRKGALRTSGPLMPRANIYVDGFNLYFGALQNTPFRWLNLRELAAGLLKPGIEIGRIRYFTARVSNRDSHPGSPARQHAYLSAISTLPEVEIEFGLFRQHPRALPLADGTGFATVLRTEEKGSDVNLATGSCWTPSPRIARWRARHLQRQRFDHPGSRSEQARADRGYRRPGLSQKPTSSSRTGERRRLHGAYHTQAPEAAA